MVSNAAKYIIRECEEKGYDLRKLHEHVAIQINDTHPSMVIPELIRLLVQKQIDFNEAIEIVQKTCASFGPLMILALFWKKVNTKGALAGMIVGFVTIILWNTFLISDGIIAGGDWCLFDTGLYELVPGFILSFIAIVVVSKLTGYAEADVQKEYDEYQEELKNFQ